MLMGVKEIQEIIPHRHPFLLIDCIEELEPGLRAVGYKCVTYDAEGPCGRGQSHCHGGRQAGCKRGAYLHGWIVQTK